MEIPCIANLDFNCPEDCRLHFMALKKIVDLAAQLSVREGRIVSVEETIGAMRKMNPGQKIVHNSQNAQILRHLDRLGECSKASSAPPSLGRDQ